MKIDKSYSLYISEYSADYKMPWEEEAYKGWAVMSISEEEYVSLKEAGVKVEEYSQVVFSKSSEKVSEGEADDSRIIRQLLFHHIAYVDKADHTNF